MVLSTLRDMEYRITMRATYTPTTYSLTYVSSQNLKTLKADDYIPIKHGETLENYAKTWRETRGALQPEYTYAVNRADLSIHPTYELLVYELSAGVRRHLRLVQ